MILFYLSANFLWQTTGSVAASAAFFIAICYYTHRAVPWIYPPIVFYSLDLALRLVRYRVKSAILEACDTQITLIRIPDVSGGWVAGQHVHLRVFFGSQTFESHSFTIANAPSSISALGDIHPGGIMLAARAYSDWTQGLHSFACERSDTVERVKVLLDGPYGDSTLDYGTYESVLLVAGGSGVTFTLGILDNLVGRVVRLGRPNGECTQRISFAWYIRSFRDIAWSEPYLMTIARMAQGSSVEVIFISLSHGYVISSWSQQSRFKCQS